MAAVTAETLREKGFQIIDHDTCYLVRRTRIEEVSVATEHLMVGSDEVRIGDDILCVFDYDFFRSDDGDRAYGLYRTLRNGAPQAEPVSYESAIVSLLRKTPVEIVDPDAEREDRHRGVLLHTDLPPR